MKTYRLVAMGDMQKVVTSKRVYLAQTIGKLAALSIPTSEMARLWKDCGGNLETVLVPIREALNDAGYSDVLILPSQTKFVSLEPTGEAIPEPDELEYVRGQLDLLLCAINRTIDAFPQRATNELRSVIGQIEVGRGR